MRNLIIHQRVIDHAKMHAVAQIKASNEVPENEREAFIAGVVFGVDLAMRQQLATLLEGNISTPSLFEYQ